MGLVVGGKGTSEAHLTKQLRTLESDLEAILNLPLDKIEIPKKKADQQKLAGELDRKIEILTQFETTPDDLVRGKVKHMLQLTRAARLDLEGEMLSWALQGTANPNATPSAVELGAIFAMFGKSFSNGEMTHALKILEPHLDADLKAEMVHPLANATVAYADKVGTRTSGKSRKVFLARTIPVMGGLFVARAIQHLAALEPAVSLAVNLASIQTGFQIGMRTGSKAVATEGYAFGVGRFEGEVDHDLAMLHEHASTLHSRLFKVEDGPAKNIVDKDVALLKMITTKRRETWDGRDVPAIEKKAVAKFEALAAQLESGGVAAARGQVKGLGFSAKELKKLPSLPQLVPPKIDKAETAEAFGIVVSESAKQYLNVANMPLKRLIALLESKHLDGSALSNGEAEALRRAVGEAPNVAEVLALGRLANAGAVDLNNLWPDGKIIDKNGSPLTPEDSKMIFDTLGDRGRGANIQSMSRIVGLAAPFLAAGAAWLAATLLGDPGIDTVAGAMSLFGAISASIGTHIGGFFLGRHIENKGAEIRMMQGIEIPSALGNEYAMVLPRLLDPDAFLAGGIDSAKKALATEGEVLDVVLDSVGTALAHIEQALGTMMTTGAPPSPQDRMAFETLSRTLQNFKRSKQTHYEVLSQVRTELTRIGGEATTAEELREGFAEIRSSLYGLMPITWGDIVLSGAVDEFSPGLAQYYGHKMSLLEGLKTWDGKSNPPESVRNAAAAMFEISKLLPKQDRPENKDVLDKLANTIEKRRNADRVLSEKGKPENTKPIVERSQLLEARDPKLEDTVKKARVSDLSIDSKRAGEIGQEMMTALFAQLFPIYGLSDRDGAVPKLKSVNVKPIASDDPYGFGSFRVEGSLDGGGKFAATINAAGRMSENLDELVLDLGAKNLAPMTERAVSAHLEALTGKSVNVGRAKLAAQHDDGRRTFSVGAGSRSFEVTIGPKGELDNESIREK